jgi:hypothetical protein
MGPRFAVGDRLPALAETQLAAASDDGRSGRQIAQEDHVAAPLALDSPVRAHQALILLSGRTTSG